ncbi:MAG: hypothetical protein H7062_11755, partial [Candidatus Saccharimonas sp.]|nr:hypothetical protein [Planctomycetaceae bacterium]
MRAVADKVRRLTGGVCPRGVVRAVRSAAWMSLIAGMICGCAAWRSREPRVQNPVVEHYNQVAERIAYPSAGSQPVALPPNLGQTRPLVEPKPEERRPISLAEAVQLGLRNNALVRQDAQFLSRGNPLLVNPDAVPSIFDTEIQDNGVLFGSRGIHAALSDFDPRLTTSTQWGRDENVQNN